MSTDKLATIPNANWTQQGQDDEQRIIGLALTDRPACEAILNGLTAEEFTHWELSRVFYALQKTYQQDKTPPTIHALDVWLANNITAPEDRSKAMQFVHQCFRHTSFFSASDIPPIMERIKARHVQAVTFELMKDKIDDLLRVVDPVKAAGIVADLKEKFQGLSATATLPDALTLDQFNHGDDYGGNLLGNRFLCRAGGLLLAAPTGIGKSSWSLQAAVSWSLGLPHLGIKPAGQLTSLLIQAENDAGDVSELRDGVFRGLNLTAEQIADASQRVKIICETATTGTAFVAMVEALVAKHRPDLLFVDPLFAYLGNDVCDQEAVSKFLRNGLNPVLQRYGCGLLLVHHTNKPQKVSSESAYQAGDFAYMGSGTGELANWARAVIAIRNVGEHEVYEMILGKRGKRAGLSDEWDKTLYSVFIHHSQTGICWHVGDAPASGRTFSKADVLNLVPITGAISKAKFDNDATDAGLPQKRMRGWLAELIEDDQLFVIETPRPGKRPALSYSRQPLNPVATGKATGNEISLPVTTPTKTEELLLSAGNFLYLPTASPMVCQQDTGNAVGSPLSLFGENNHE